VAATTPAPAPVDVFESNLAQLKADPHNKDLLYWFQVDWKICKRAIKEIIEQEFSKEPAIVDSAGKLIYGLGGDKAFEIVATYTDSAAYDKKTVDIEASVMTITSRLSSKDACHKKEAKSPVVPTVTPAPTPVPTSTLGFTQSPAVQDHVPLALPPSQSNLAPAGGPQDRVATLYRAAEEAKWKAIQFESAYGASNSWTKGYWKEYQEKLNIANWAYSQYGGKQ
jgi:hypothetical protein